MAGWTENLFAELEKNVVRALTRTAIACTNDLKRVVSVAAPRRVSKRTGRVYAATKATPGAPPRKLTGRGRASLSYKVDKSKFMAVVGTNVIYMRVHEESPPGSPGLHRYVEPTMRLNGARYERLLAGGV